MTTTTILRVKRRLDENPADALVLHCKKAKLQNEESPAHSVFVFSATVDDHVLFFTYWIYLSYNKFVT